MPVVTKDHPAIFPDINSIHRSSIGLTIQFTFTMIYTNNQMLIIKLQSMKQNQSLYRPVYGEKTQITQHDFLNLKASCQCSRCLKIYTQVNPQIKFDNELHSLRQNNTNINNLCDQVIFLNQFHEHDKFLPKFRFLDTIVLHNGQPSYAIYFQNGKSKISHITNIKSWIVERKGSLDLQYQIKKYQRENNNFNFVAFQHESQKKIKEFQNNIQYKFPSILNKMAYIKVKNVRENKNEEVLLVKNEFLDIFDLNKVKKYDLTDIEYIQVFPIMYGEENHSYEKIIRFFRNRCYLKKSFKLAENYMTTWKWRNESLQKMQDKVFQEIAQSQGLSQITEDLKLQYMTYKILIYFEDISNLRIQEAIIHYITNDNGITFFFKTIECIKFQKRTSIEDIGIDLPTKKEIPVQDHIVLKDQMFKMYNNFQTQYDRLHKQREEMETKLKKDKEYSNYVFQTINKKKGENFHKILSSNSENFKKHHLNL